VNKSDGFPTFSSDIFLDARCTFIAGLEADLITCFQQLSCHGLPRYRRLMVVRFNQSLHDALQSATISPSRRQPVPDDGIFEFGGVEHCLTTMRISSNVYTLLGTGSSSLGGEEGINGSKSIALRQNTRTTLRPLCYSYSSACTHDSRHDDIPLGLPGKASTAPPTDNSSRRRCSY
jgi:hypothetical protein